MMGWDDYEGMKQPLRFRTIMAVRSCDDEPCRSRPPSFFGWGRLSERAEEAMMFLCNVFGFFTLQIGLDGNFLLVLSMLVQFYLFSSSSSHSF